MTPDGEVVWEYVKPVLLRRAGPAGAEQLGVPRVPLHAGGDRRAREAPHEGLAGRRAARAVGRRQRRGRLGDEPRRGRPWSRRRRRARRRAQAARAQLRQREQLPVRDPRGRAAGARAPAAPRRARHLHGGGGQPRAGARAGAGHRRRRPRGVCPRLALDPSVPDERRRGARLHPQGGGEPGGVHRRAAVGLALTLPGHAEHPAAARRRGLHVSHGRLQRRRAVLGSRGGATDPDHPVRARLERHEDVDRAGLHARGVAAVRGRHLRPAVRGRRRGPAHDVARGAPADHRAARPDRLSRSLPRPRREPRGRVGGDTQGHRRALDRRESAPRHLRLSARGSAR